MDYGKVDNMLGKTEEKIAKNKLESEKKIENEFNNKKRKIREYEKFLRGLVSNEKLKKIMINLNEIGLEKKMVIPNPRVYIVKRVKYPFSGKNIFLSYDKDIKQLTFTVECHDYTAISFYLRKFKKSEIDSEINQKLYESCFKDGLILTNSRRGSSIVSLVTEVYDLLKETTPQKMAKEFNTNLEKTVEEYTP